MDKIEVYHAGPEIVERPDCLRGRKNLDFGQGFTLQTYMITLTNSPSQKRATVRKIHSSTYIYLTARLSFKKPKP